MSDVVIGAAGLALGGDDHYQTLSGIETLDFELSNF